MIGIGATVLAVEGRACPRCEEPLVLRIVAGTPEFVGKHKDSEAHHFTWPTSLWGGQYQGCLTYACLNCGNRVDVWLTNEGEWEVVET